MIFNGPHVLSRAFRQLYHADFQTPAKLCQALNTAPATGTTTTKYMEADVSRVLNAYPEIFSRSSAYVFLNPMESVLVSRLLSLADNVVILQNNR